jgi:DNA processing protein
VSCLTTPSAPRDWLIAISQIEGIGRRTLTKIYPLLELLSKDKQLFIQSIRSIPTLDPRRKEKLKAFSETDVLCAKEKLANAQINVLTPLDPLFPSNLREIADPPFVLYALGNLQLLSQPAIAIVGTRIPTSYGRQVSFHLAEDLSRAGFVIVSGLAKGIDTEAHKGAISSGNATIAVLGNGIDVVYPPQNKYLCTEISKKGLLLSEYPPGTQPSKYTFPERNRLISGLSLGIVVVEAAGKSGTSVTTECALDQGKDVFSVPGSILSPQSVGPNRLIKQGAKPVTHVQDIINEYICLPSIKNKLDKYNVSDKLSVNEKKILDMIENTQVTIEQVVYTTSLPLQEVQKCLVTLQLKGMIKQLPGTIYMKL